VRIVSAHLTPELMFSYASSAYNEAYKLLLLALVAQLTCPVWLLLLIPCLCNQMQEMNLESRIFAKCHNYIGSEHLLLGLLREGEGVAARVLENLGADPANILTQVIRMVGESADNVGATGGSGSSSNKMPTLEEYGTNLTKLAEEGKLDPVVGRQQQIERVTQILGRPTKNNPCLIGEPGVGKTAIAEGLAQHIANEDVPETIEGKKVITLDMGLLVVGTKYREEFEERLKKLMEEIKQSDEIILFIDEVHTLIGAGAAEGAIDAANILKPALARGELQ
ncbi:hypothetical protein S245_063996, partial [Arachis hypogaea]